MNRLPEFGLCAPATWDELRDVLAAGDGSSRIMAGGTELMVNLKYGLCAPGQIIWLGKITELRTIKTDANYLRVGAMCTLADVAASSIVRERCAPLCAAISGIASPPIRNRATVGGNLCIETRCVYYNQSAFWRLALGGCLKLPVPPGTASDCHVARGRTACTATCCSDLAPLFIALDAELSLWSIRGERTIPAADLYHRDGAHNLSLNPGEIITSVHVPVAARRAAVHKKIRARESIDFAAVNAGVSLVRRDGDMCEDIRIVIGAVDSAPVRVHAAESMLRGERLTQSAIAACAQCAAESVDPLPHTLETAGYRRRMAGVLVRNALSELAGGT